MSSWSSLRTCSLRRAVGIVLDGVGYAGMFLGLALAAGVVWLLTLRIGYRFS